MLLQIHKIKKKEMALVVKDVLRFVKLTENGYTPTKGTKDAAGFDLYSAYDYEIQPHGKILAQTDIQVAVPYDCYGRIAPRSGLACKHFIDVGAGVIDRDYRGNVGVILFNFGSCVFKSNKILFGIYEFMRDFTQ
jgi:dUTP pyrophosphatase